MRLCFVALLLTAAFAVTPGSAQAPDTPPVSVAVAPPDVAAPPPDAQTTASGLASKVLTPGTGTIRPTPLDVVTAHYTGWRAGGDLITSSVLRGIPGVLAMDRVIDGLGEGLQLMVEGEKRRLWIPAVPAVEGDADSAQPAMTFDVELLDILPSPTPPPDVAAAPDDAIRASSGLVSRVLEPGRGSDRPGGRDTVTVHYSGWTTDGEMFDSSVIRREPATFRLDEVIPGWTEGLQLMVEGEKRRLWIPESLAYRGQAGAPRGMLVFDVMLIAISR